MFKLHDDWVRIVRYAWSIRLLVLLALLSGAEAAMPFVVERYDDVFPWPHWVNYVAIFAVTIAALVARVVAQKRFQGV
ncbi:hypothetical protein RA307_09755 [Xanthobacteraceae bacterium Astr-EGSB]|uniref:DUF7940 domain-containing protein n=1 Tax=Astrobacterium formosum TaxID=3069710 RepID=UPI0027B0FDEE|nr:hypothetical protein [Xanthobacteraceae bacterium Astr-EGSB]